MPKKKASKKSHKRTGTRRRIGATGAKLNANSMLVKGGAALAGYFLSDTINAAIDKATGGKMDGKIIGGAEVGLGALLVLGHVTKRPSMVTSVAGGALAGAGIKRLLKELGVISGIGGYQAMPVLGSKHAAARRLNGYGSVPVIGGYSPNRGNLNGVFNGYQVPKMPNNVVGCTDYSSSSFSNGSEMMG